MTDRRKPPQQRRNRSPLSQAKDNNRRVEYMMENYQRISDGVENFKSENGRMPAIILLVAKVQQIIIAGKLEPFVENVKPVLGTDMEVLKLEMVNRDYADDDCLLLVDTGSGILRTSFANAKLRHALGMDGSESVDRHM